MWISTTTFVKHIFHVHLHIPSDLVLEDFIHQALVSAPVFFRPKGIKPEIEKTLVSDKNSFLLILRNHPDLVITRKNVHEAEKIIARNGIHHPINPCSEQLFFEHVWLRSLKLMQIHLPFVFFTMTILKIHAK